MAGLERGMAATRDSLARELRALGLHAGDIVMLHASYRAIRPVEGGPDAVLDALMQAVQPGGGLVMFVSWANTPYDAFARGGPDPAARAEWPAFDPATAPVHPGYGGAIGACLAAREGAVRSRNPDRSLLGWGAAAPLIADQPLDHGFGPGSPLARLHAREAKVLNLGAPLYTATILHLAEYLADVPGKRHVRYEVPVLEGGAKVWRAVTQMDRDGFVAAAAGQEPDYLEQVIRDYIAAGRAAEGRVGAARALLYEMADLVPFAVRHFEARYGRLGD